MGLTDELASGVVPAGSPDLTGTFGLSPSAAAGWTLLALQAMGVVLEPPLLALARGHRARSLRTLGLACMAGSLLLAAAAPSYPLLLAALALYGPASGLGTQLAQAALLARSPARREAVLARWELLSSAGDLLAPALLAGSVLLGLGWRGALFGAGLAAAAQTAASAGLPVAAEVTRDGEAAEAPLRHALRAALASPALLGWSAVVALCGLMDELLVSFGALRLAELGMDAPQRAAVLSAWVVGGMAGAVLLERLAPRAAPRALLLAAGLGSAAAYAAWLCARTPLASAALAGLAGLFTAAHYPLARARAFAALPGREHVVLAVGSAFSALELLLPVLVGVVADGAGLAAALLVLLAQPAAIILAGLGRPVTRPRASCSWACSRRSRSRPQPPGSPRPRRRP